VADADFRRNLLGQSDLTSVLANPLVTTDQIVAGAVTTSKLAAGAVTNNELAGSILGSKLADNSVAATKISQVAWTTFTPVWTASSGLTTAGGTLTGGYYKIGRWLVVQMDFTYTGGMTLPTGTYFLALPSYTAVGTRYQPGVAMYHGAGTNRWAGTCSPIYAGAGATKLAAHWHGVANPWGQNVPMVPAVGDIVTLTWSGETTT
jgi:hypothetical protein